MRTSAAAGALCPLLLHTPLGGSCRRCCAISLLRSTRCSSCCFSSCRSCCGRSCTGAAASAAPPAPPEPSPAMLALRLLRDRMPVAVMIGVRLARAQWARGAGRGRKGRKWEAASKELLSGCCCLLECNRAEEQQQKAALSGLHCAASFGAATLDRCPLPAHAPLLAGKPCITLRTTPSAAVLALCMQ